MRFIFSSVYWLYLLTSLFSRSQCFLPFWKLSLVYKPMQIHFNLNKIKQKHLLWPYSLYSHAQLSYLLFHIYFFNFREHNHCVLTILSFSLCPYEHTILPRVFAQILFLDRKVQTSLLSLGIFSSLWRIDLGGYTNKKYFLTLVGSGHWNLLCEPMCFYLSATVFIQCLLALVPLKHVF